MFHLNKLIFILCFSTFSCVYIGKNSKKQEDDKPSIERQTQSLKENQLTREISSIPLADSHFHTRNYIQEGLTLKETHKLLSKHGVQRAAVFGIPLQQKWNMNTHVSPSYYLHDDQALYYYSAIDAFIAVEYQSLPKSKKKMFDPMIVGFNPTDGRAVDHIKNMLLKFPNTFSGIGEFSIKKEIVSGKIYGEPADLKNPALEKILKFAEEVGLVVILHCDVDAMISKNKLEPSYLKPLEQLFQKHKNTKIIWAHTGLGRYIKGRPKHIEFVKRILSLSPNFFVDISWDQVVRQFFDAEGKLLNDWKDFLKEHSKQIVFGSDSVAPNSSSYKELLNIYQRIWKELPFPAVQNITYLNYKRLFDSARLEVRRWEKNHLLLDKQSKSQ